MNNKILISLIFVIIGLGIGGVFYWHTSLESTPSSNLQGISLSPLVKGCAETENGTATKSFNYRNEEEPTIKVERNEISYHRAIHHLCCRKVEIKKETNRNVINIYEVWSGVGCKCMCFSEIGARLQNVPPGTYTVNVYETGTKPGSEEPMEQKLIISQNVVVK